MQTRQKACWCNVKYRICTTTAAVLFAFHEWAKRVPSLQHRNKITKPKSDRFIQFISSEQFLKWSKHWISLSELTYFLIVHTIHLFFFSNDLILHTILTSKRNNEQINVEKYASDVKNFGISLACRVLLLLIKTSIDQLTTKIATEKKMKLYLSLYFTVASCHLLTHHPKF